MRFTKTLSTAAFITISVFSAFADSGFQCASCHEKPSDVLQSKHIQVQDFHSCFSCHIEDKEFKLSNTLHSAHFTHMDIDNAACVSCHIEENGAIRVDTKNNFTADTESALTAFKSFYQTGTLANSHKNAGLSCDACHKAYDYDEADSMSSKCVNCHGSYEELAKITEDTEYDANPHKSHYPTLACTKCHSAHSQFQDFCSKCHQWNYSWKQKVNK